MVYMKSKEQPEDVFENLAAEILLGPTLMLVHPNMLIEVEVGTPCRPVKSSTNKLGNIHNCNELMDLSLMNHSLL